MKLAPLVLLLTSCTLTTETGYVSDALTTNRYGNETIEALVTSTRMEFPSLILGPLRFTVGGAPTFYRPFDGKSSAVGVDATFELSYASPLEPFLLFTAGLFQSQEPWGRQATDWGFTNQLGIGVRYQGLSLSYRQFHESNGATFWGNGHRPNPGFESGGIWLGYEVSF